MKNATIPRTMIAKGMPNPMPIFAPLDNPFELGVPVEVLVGVDVGVDNWCVVVLDGGVAVDELDAL
jgi:hypothetical protein